MAMSVKIPEKISEYIRKPYNRFINETLVSDADVIINLSKLEKLSLLNPYTLRLQSLNMLNPRS
ncbi:MAG: hypothetical protein WA240_07165 [Nitrospirota bacterium]|jgi:hypothetical protein